MSACASSQMCRVATQPQPVRARRRIVFVDDEQPILETWGAILSQSGYEVECFSDPTAAMRAIAAGCDCVITDYHMPKMTGVELIRAARKASPTKFILMTANLSDAVAREAKSSAT